MPRVCHACLGPCAQFGPDGLTFRVLLVVERLRRFACEQAETLDLCILQLRVRRGGLDVGLRQLYLFAFHRSSSFLQAFCSWRFATRSNAFG